MFISVDGGKLPQASTKYSAGLDVFANEDVEIWAGASEVVKLGIKLDLDYINKNDLQNNHFLMLEVRSSMRMKEISSFGVGIIDLDYQDEIKMIIHNHSKFSPVIIRKGDKVGQLLLMVHNPYATWKYRQTEQDRVGGFGSTGK